MAADRIKVGVLLSGRGTNMIALAEYKRREERNYDIALIASNVPDARGLVVARRLAIPTWARSHKDMERAEFDRLLDAELRERKVEVIALAGYMRLLSPEFVKAWEGRILNIHPSLLPLYKGLDTHGRALAAGDLFAGCSVHVVTEELDAGPVVAQAKLRIRPRDTAETLAARVLEEEHKLYPEALDAFAGTLRVQDAAEGEVQVSPDHGPLLAEIRRLCLELPETSEKISHNIPAFAVAGKMFAYFRHDHHGDSMTVVCVKTSGREEQDMLIESDPGLYSWPAYIGSSGWIALNLEPTDTDWNHVADRIAQSWELAAPDRLLEAGGR